MTWRNALAGLATALAFLTAAPALAQTRPVYGPVDDQGAGGWDGQVSISATYAKRDRVLVSDYDRSGLGAQANVGYELRARATTVRFEAQVSTDKYTTSYGGETEVRQSIGKVVAVSLSASGTKHQLTLESTDTDQVAVRAALQFKAENTSGEVYGRKRWRWYNDTFSGKGEGYQVGGKLRQRFGPYHWIEFAGFYETIDDNGGRHGYRRTGLSFDYSHPVAKRLRVLLGTDYRTWTYQGRQIADVVTNPRRSDRLVRPEVGLSWGKTKGLYARATAGYDFYRSNDARYSGDGPRLRATVGYRF